MFLLLISLRFDLLSIAKCSSVRFELLLLLDCSYLHVRDFNMSKTIGLPEFSLANKVVLVSGAARGLGLTQAEALLEAGARGVTS